MPARLVVLILLGSVLAGCEDESSPPEVEVFSGELAIAEIKELPPYTYHYTDTVVLTVDGSIYRLEHITNESNLCSSRGKVVGFGTNILRLTPTSTDHQNCDSIKVPQGEFKSVFRGDSLYLGPSAHPFTWIDSSSMNEHTDTMIYDFRLTK